MRFCHVYIRDVGRDFTVVMENFRPGASDLPSMLRNALMDRGVALDPFPRERDVEDYPGDPAVAYIRGVLMDEDGSQEDHQEIARSGEFSKILSEFSSIVAENSSGGDPGSLLLHCAQDVAAGNSRRALVLVSDLKSFLSSRSRLPDSQGISCGDRAISFFLDALTARLGGIGARAYAAMAREVDHHLLVRMRSLPYLKLSQRFANEMILDLMDHFHERRNDRRPFHRLHIVDYGIQHGFQWPHLIEALAQRYRDKGGIELKITGVEYPSVANLEDTGRNLVDFAAKFGISLEFMAVATEAWEKERIIRCENEVVVVNCVLRLRHLRDHGTVAVDRPREVFFKRIHGLNPDLVVLADVSADMSSPLFLQRFKESLNFYRKKLEYFAAVAGDIAEVYRHLERVAARDIMNIVACEGLDRVERATSHGTWDARARRAGFVEVPLSDEIYGRVRRSCGQPDVGTAREGNWMLMGWKNTVLYAMSAWRPKRSPLQLAGMFQAL